MKSFDNGIRPSWCPGCGDFAILTALKNAFVAENIHPHEVMIVSGIGCGSKLPDYIHANGFMTIHGRPLPVATGIHLAHHEMHVVVVDGDGDAYGIGGNHLLHTLRRNPNLTHIVENNQIYALTKGQYSPTSHKGFKTTTSPEGAIETPVLPTALAFTGGATFIARGFSGEPKHLARLIAAGLRHRGYALIDVLQPCVTFNKLNTYEWYQERVYKVDEQEGYSPENRQQAAEVVNQWGDRIPIGILYQEQGRPTYEDQVTILKDGPLATRPLEKLPDPVFEQLKESFV